MSTEQVKVKDRFQLTPLEIGTATLEGYEGTPLRVKGVETEDCFVLGPIHWAGNMWTCLADIRGMLCLVEVTLWSDDESYRIQVD